MVPVKMEKVVVFLRENKLTDIEDTFIGKVIEIQCDFIINLEVITEINVTYVCKLDEG